jgi:polar amino acid transport system substrate-binding protein
MKAPEPAALRDLAPTGTMRAAVNVANAALVIKGADGSLAGRIPDLARRLGRWLGVPVGLVPYPSGGAILADLGAGRWDVAFLAVDPARADRLIYSRPFAQVEATFAVLDGSPLTNAADADRPGLTIAAARDAAYELHLKRTLAFAKIVSHNIPAAALESVLSGRCDLAAGIRDALEKAAVLHPQLRILAGAFLVVPQAIALEINRRAGAASVESFLEQRGENST